MKISCPRCLKNDLAGSEDTGYVDLWNQRVCFYKCRSCSLVFFIQIPWRSDNWRLPGEGEIVYHDKEVSNGTKS